MTSGFVLVTEFGFFFFGLEDLTAGVAIRIKSGTSESTVNQYLTTSSGITSQAALWQTQCYIQQYLEQISDLNAPVDSLV